MALAWGVREFDPGDGYVRQRTVAPRPNAQNVATTEKAFSFL
jgi:hypothetical protein